ncbi:MAG: type II toxin-antitoxin system VapC family toxin [Chitinophagaceae bacterium]|jgi:ribonuclease VapC|nr:type II toxin-antitoxin system VapC family toxin [Chitinophagaceae bacterium]
MQIIILDSYAMLAFFRNENGADFIEGLLVEASEGRIQLVMTAINAGEVYYMSVRKDGQATAEKVWDALLNFPIDFHHIDIDFSLKAARIKATYKMSFADAFAASLAIDLNGLLVTGDKEFVQVSESESFSIKLI